MESSVAARGGQFTGPTVRAEGRASEILVMSLRKRSQKRGLTTLRWLYSQHTHTSSACPGALSLCRIEDSSGVRAWKPGPLGTSGGVPVHGGMELPRALAAHMDNIFPTPWTVDRLSSPLAMLQTINSGLGFSHSQESSHRLPQPGEGWRYGPLACGGLLPPPARRVPSGATEGCMILQTCSVPSVALPAS